MSPVRGKFESPWMWTPFKFFNKRSSAATKWVPVLFNRHHLVSILLLLTGLMSSTVLPGAIQLKQGGITLYSDRGDTTLLRNAARLIQGERASYPERYGLRLDQPLQVWFYYDPQASDVRLHSVPYWSTGIARAGSEIHIYGRNRSQWLATLRHELFHALLGQNEIDIPVWLNEGLAQWQAGQTDWAGFMELGTATAQGSLIPLVDLDVILSFNHKKASLAYAQALDATRFLIQRQGASVLPFLLTNEDRSFRQRFRAETSEDILDFEIAWREDLERRFWFFKISQIPTILWALSPLIVVLAWFLKRRRNQRKLKQWELEEDFEDGPKFLA